MEQKNAVLKFHIADPFTNLLADTKSVMHARDKKVWMGREWDQYLAVLWGIVPEAEEILPLRRILCHLLGFTHAVNPDGFPGTIIATEKQQIKKVTRAAEILSNYLKYKQHGCTEGEIMKVLKTKKAGVEPYCLQAILTSIGYEETHDKTWVKPLNEVTTLSDKAYRILLTLGHPTTLDVIQAAIHKECPEDFPNIRSLAHATIYDPRFGTIGKSGLRTLAEWNIKNNTVKEAVLQALVDANRPLTIDEIHKIVANGRRCSIHSVMAYLNDKQTFTKVGARTYAPKSWNLPTSTARAYNSPGKQPSQEAVQIDKTAALLVKTSHAGKIPLSELVKTLADHFQVKRSKIYPILKRSRAITISAAPDNKRLCGLIPNPTATP
jgi:hypothetical protein